MAALMESIAFTNISSEVDIIDISDANVEGNILVSSRKKNFVIYKLSDQKPQNSWSVRHGVTLTSPVRWDHSHERFVTVTNNHDVKLWDKDLGDFSRAKTKHSTAKIHEAFTLLDYPDITVLYSNGCVGFLDGIKDNHDTGPLTEGDAIVWCKGVMISSVLCVLFLAQKKDEVCLYVNRFSVEEGKWHTESTTLSNKEGKSLFCAVDCIHVKDGVNVYVLWQDGCLTKASVLHQSIDISYLPQRISGIHGNCGMVVIDATHIAVAGCTNDTNKQGIGIFDIKFGIQQTWQVFTEKPNNKCKIFCVQGHLFVPCRRTLYACKYECHTSTVGSILGRNVTNTEQIPQHHLWSALQKKTEEPSLQEDLTKQFNQLIDKPLKHDTFKSCFTKLMKALDHPQNQYWLSSSHMTSLIQRIVGETKFWPKQELRLLVEKQFIPASSIDVVVDSLIKHSEINMVHDVVNKTSNLPEKSLCKILVYYLQYDETENKTALSETVNKDELIEDPDELEDMDIDDEGVGEEDEVYKPTVCPVDPHKAYIINEVMLKPYSDVFLLECLRTISFKHAQKLLEYLSYLLEKKSLLSDTSGKHNQLTVPQVVDWLCLVIDAHMTQFVLSPYSHLTLIKLHSVVSSQVKFMSSLVNLEALLLQLKEKSVLMQDKKVGQYCIEVLHLL